METIPIPGAEIYYDKNFLPAEEATILFSILLRDCAWQRHRSSFKYAVPRDNTEAMLRSLRNPELLAQDLRLTRF